MLPRITPVSVIAVASAIGICIAALSPHTTAADAPPRDAAPKAAPRVSYKSVSIDGVDVFYREAGPPEAPAVLLLHGFPTSSHMFRNLIPALADRYHVIAPDYPGFGHSAMPARDAFDYSFENLASVVDEFTETIGLSRFVVYVQDYGAPIGYRIASAHPERIAGIIAQNGNAYDEGLNNDFWKPIKAYWADPTSANREALRGLLAPAATTWQYTHGVRDVSVINPDSWTIDQALLDRPGNTDIQLDLFLSYGTNLPLYPKWQAYFRDHQPPTLIVWGANDQIFPAAGAHPYRRDLTDLEFHLLDTGHFALEEDGATIAAHIRAFLARVYPAH